MSNSESLVQKPSLTRYDFIDILKAFAIILVVLGHSILSDDLYNWIYSFHMPLFFMISGFLISQRHLEMKNSDFAKDILYKYFYPYLILYGVLIVHYFLNGKLDFKALFFNFIFGTGFLSWFLASLCLCRICVQYASRILNKWVLLGLSLILANLSIYYSGFDFIPAIFKDTSIAFFFYMFGFCIKDYLTPSKYNKKILAVIMFSAFVLSIIVSRNIITNGISIRMFTGEDMLFIPISFIGIIAFASLSMLLKVNIVFLWISKNTMVIFIMHTFFMGTVRTILTKIHERFFELTYFYSVLYIIIAIISAFVLSIPAKFVFSKLFPKVFKA